VVSIRAPVVRAFALDTAPDRQALPAALRQTGRQVDRLPWPDSGADLVVLRDRQDVAEATSWQVPAEFWSAAVDLVPGGPPVGIVVFVVATFALGVVIPAIWSRDSERRRAARTVIRDLLGRSPQGAQNRRQSGGGRGLLPLPDCSDWLCRGLQTPSGLVCGERGARLLSQI
jgi:hypothetical protein